MRGEFEGPTFSPAWMAKGRLTCWSSLPGDCVSLSSVESKKEWMNPW